MSSEKFRLSEVHIQVIMKNCWQINKPNHYIMSRSYSLTLTHFHFHYIMNFNTECQNQIPIIKSITLIYTCYFFPPYSSITLPNNNKGKNSIIWGCKSWRSYRAWKTSLLCFVFGKNAQNPLLEFTLNMEFHWGFGCNIKPPMVLFNV